MHNPWHPDGNRCYYRLMFAPFLSFFLRGGASPVVVIPTTDAYVEYGYVEAAYVTIGAPLVPAISSGTFTFAQAPTSAETFDPVALSQASTATLGLTGIRHNLLMTRSDTIAGDFSRFVAQWNAMQSAGLKLCLCLFDGGSGGAGMPYPGDDANPTTAAAERTAWANIAVTGLLHLQTNYSGLLAAAELWNEPDGGWPVPADKLVLLAAALRTAMRAQPALNNIPLVAPATVTGEGTYWQTLIANGLMNHVDWVSHHMYSEPHVLERRIANLRAKLPDPDPPIFISEFGGNQTTPINKAYEVAATLTMLRALNVYAGSHFTLKDYGTVSPPTGFPDHGLLNSDGSIGDQGRAWRTWHQTVGGSATYVGRDSLPSNVQCRHFTVGSTHVRVVWASAGTPSISISGTYTAKDVFGTTITAGATQVLGLAPIYLTGNVTVTFTTTPPQETLLTDPQTDFATTQGQNGWTYQSLSGSTYTDAVADQVNDQWTIAGSNFWQIGPTTGHPAAGGVAAVRKWTVPAGVTRVRVTGTWARTSPGGDGSDVSLRLNTTVRFRRAALLGATATITQIFDVATGNVLEFRVAPGPGTDITNDNTVLRVQVYATSAATNSPDIA